ncbi:MAG: acetylglutamate kinase [Candidatus Pelagibacterales bacterium]|jgi:acetylglutamate kinase|tara:strand:- start:6733 stop:7623 length:891 start_codon:yes stop_codon:yes gene_type:complete
MGNDLDIALQRAKIFNKLWPQGKSFHKKASNYADFYQDKIIVIKYGGFALSNQKIVKSFAKNISLFNQLGLKVVIVHGGGPQIEKELLKQKIVDREYQGLRVTTKKILSIVKRIIARELNPMIVKNITQQGGSAQSINGITKKIIKAKKILNGKIGFVGTPTGLDKNYILSLLEKNIVPVISPLGFDNSGNTYNINADTAAGYVAEALKAERLILLTDVAGVLDNKKNLIQALDQKKAFKYIKNGTITGGMLPKIKTCFNIIKKGVKGVVIIDGRNPNATVLELFTKKGAGTLISK